MPKSSVVSVPEMSGSRSYPRIPQKLKDTTYAAGGIPVLIADIEIPDAILVLVAGLIMGYGLRRLFRSYWDREDEVNGNKQNHEKRDAIAVGAMWSALVFGVLAAWLLELPNAVPIALFLVSRLMIYSGTALAGLWLWWHLAKRS